MQQRIFTVGHSTRPLEEFIALLRAQNITQLVDICTIPRSRHNPQYGLTTLIKIAKEHTSAIMCADAVPWRCHRSLIVDALVARGILVCDIIGPARVKEHILTLFAVVSGASLIHPGTEETS